MKLTTILPAIYGLALFSLVRLANDIPLGSNYLEHSSLFITIEIVGVIVGCYLSFSLFGRWINFSRKRMIGAYVEYGAVVVFSSMLAFVVMLMSHGGVTNNGSDIVIPLIVVALMSVGLYSGMKSSSLSRLYDEQRLRNEIMRNERMQSELQSLKAQYHPHFLFNMLNTIYFTIDEGNEKARDTVEHLANLLRRQLYDSDEKTGIDREISVVRSYVALAAMRFGDRLSMEMNIDPELGDEQIYPHLFLPLVENAFKHCGGDNAISIDIRSTYDGVMLTVINSTAADSGAGHNGTGLKNLKRRLELLYPRKSHELVIKREAGRFMVTLILKLWIKRQ